jgi:hypothetical protein
MLENLTLFVSSSDSYRECWTPFFTLLKRFWPSCDLPIVLNTEKKPFAFDGLPIVCTQTGGQRSFGETFHKGLDQVHTDYVLLIMIDYFLMENVDPRNLEYAFQQFRQHDLDALYLVDMTTITATVPLAENISLVTGPGQDRFNFQAALWKKESLRKYVLKHETPWLAECFGSERFAFTHDRVGFVHKSIEPFAYLHTGVLHKGGWIAEAIPFLEAQGFSFDWAKRGIYTPRQHSTWQRLKKRRLTAIAEIKSRAHLLAMHLRWLLKLEQPRPTPR